MERNIAGYGEMNRLVSELVDWSESSYDGVSFRSEGLLQIEGTGRCNMACRMSSSVIAGTQARKGKKQINEGRGVSGMVER
jgi:hypothetical protein